MTLPIPASAVALPGPPVDLSLRSAIGNSPVTPIEEVYTGMPLAAVAATVIRDAPMISDGVVVLGIYGPVISRCC